ncbi:hypothetical protein HYU23_02005 [Candidatus Woesearchaeota archaeon]|nr:hypothetical protein [Candidatus Woesearchaeota archaeon]
MAIESKIETPEPIPRIYGLGTRTSAGVHVVYPPSAFMTAAVQLATSGELERDIEGWQRYRNELNKRTVEGKHKRSDSPVFKLTGKLAKLVDEDPKKVKEILLEAIVRREEAMNLWVKDRYEGAIQYDPKTESPYYGILHLTGRVASKSNARGRNAFRKVSISNPNLTTEGMLGIRELNCDCEDAYYNGIKDKLNAVFCHHSAALQLLYYAAVNGNDKELVRFREKLIDKPEDIPALPFNITHQNSRAIAYLNIEFLIARYLGKGNLFQINRKLSRLGYLLFSPAVNTMLREGRMWFEVVRQELRDVKEDPRYIRDTIGLMSRISEELKGEGYRRKGYCVEYEGTPYETLARRWTSEDGNCSISLVYNKDLPLHYIHKEALDLEVDLYGDRKITVIENDKTGIIDSHPYYRLGKNYREIDDMTRRLCRTRVILPGSRSAKHRIVVPTSIDKRYRSTIAIASKKA